MASTTRNATYKIYNGSDWDTYYFKTSAGQVGESSSLVFLRPATHKVNGKTFGTYNSTSKTWTHNEITLYGSDIKMSDATDAKTIKAAIEAIQADYVTSDDLDSYEYDIVDTTKAGLAPIIPDATGLQEAGMSYAFLGYSIGGTNEPKWFTLPLTAFANTNTFRPIQVNGTEILSNNSEMPVDFVSGTGIVVTASTKTDANGTTTGKIITINVQDSILGQVNYNGVFNATTRKAKLVSTGGDPLTGGTHAHIEVTIATNAEVLDGTALSKYGYVPKIGDYFIVNTAGTFDGLELEVGDWLIYNGSANGWDKVDNTDAVMSVADLKGAITANDLAAKLAVEFNDVYAAKGHNHEGVYATADHKHDSRYLTLAGGGTVNGCVVFSDLRLSANTFKTQGGTYTMTLPTKSGTLATLDDISASSHKVFTGSTTPTGMKTGDIWLQY